MHLYSALIKKNSAEKITNITFIKEGFSLSAFIFAPLWFLYHRMWSELLAFLIANLALSTLGNFLGTSDKILLEISFLLIIALNANHWLGEHLKNKNHQFVGLFFGKNSQEAQLNFTQNFADLSQFDETILRPNSKTKAAA